MPASIFEKSRMSLITESSSLGGAVDGLGELALARRERGLEQQVAHADHAVHRGADLVAHVGQELRLRAIGVVGFLRRAQRPRRWRRRARRCAPAPWLRGCGAARRPRCGIRAAAAPSSRRRARPRRSRRCAGSPDARRSRRRRAGARPASSAGSAAPRSAPGRGSRAARDRRPRRRPAAGWRARGRAPRARRRATPRRAARGRRSGARCAAARAAAPRSPASKETSAPHRSDQCASTASRTGSTATSRPTSSPARADRHRDRGLRAAVDGEQRAAARIERALGERGVAGARDHVAVAVDEGDRRRLLHVAKLLRVERQRGRMLDFEIGAELRRSGDRAIALVERGEMRLHELVGGVGGAVEARARRRPRGRARACVPGRRRRAHW